MVKERRVLVSWASRLLNTWICFQFKLPLVLSLVRREKKENGVVLVVSQYSTPTQDTITLTLLLKSKGLSVGSFLWALFQVCLGLLPGVGSEV